MKLSAETITKLAEHLENCELKANATHQITDDYADMDLEDAYAIQDEIKCRKMDRGARIVGLTVGLTSFAKMEQMGVKKPCFGFVTDYSSVVEGGAVKIAELIHPKVEPEIVFVTKKVLKGPGCHIGEVLAATDFIMPGIKVIDSRYRDFEFDLRSLIADNISASRFVVGGSMSPPAEVDMRTLGVVLEINGKIASLGAGAAVLGHPATAIAMLANHMSARGGEIMAGSMILSGGITEAVSVKAGDHVNLRIQHMGSVSMRFS